MPSVESKINLLRLIAIAALFAVHTGAYYWQPVGDPSLVSGEVGAAETARITFDMHILVTLIVMAWVMQAMAVHHVSGLASARPWLAPACIILDTLWLTALLCLTRGPGSAMVAAYFLIIATGTWRLDLRWVRLSTLVCIAGYLVVLGAARWPMGILREIPMILVPRYHQGLMVTALALAGLLADQTVRQAYRLMDLPADASTSPTMRKAT
ncbi:MAG TPA: hypothetical protein PKD54_13795 [Pirellulaceae bacterium]|nr:hypothetical protein [Pirellulaceae bacterium]